MGKVDSTCSDIYVEVMKELIKQRPEIEEMMDKEAKTALMRAILKQDKTK